jgi:hypothetical protein
MATMALEAAEKAVLLKGTASSRAVAAAFALRL